MSSLKVGVVGSGSVGASLGGQLLKKGHTVVYGTRDPASDKIKKVLTSQAGAQAKLVPETVASSDVVIIATPGTGDPAQVQALATSLGPDIKNKTVIDVTNPLSSYPGLELSWGSKSGGELLQETLPDSFVFKAFNTIGVEQMTAADGSLISGVPLTMLFAGAEEKKDVAAQIVADVGFVPKYVGPIRYARNLEAIAELWIHLGVPPVGYTKEDWGRNFHFQVISK